MAAVARLRVSWLQRPYIEQARTGAATTGLPGAREGLLAGMTLATLLAIAWRGATLRTPGLRDGLARIAISRNPRMCNAVRSDAVSSGRSGFGGVFRFPLALRGGEFAELFLAHRLLHLPRSAL
ncbi:hypothetical protein CHELA20_11054 [Hyphomicrobiales bacterium]|nr:hypothetical protein CHELA20_11054 [Hyphomicrobiales bacterium]CAH1694757.1 hypothetical protein CHELA41_51285 [Hyphomicrobiales bacterium]